MPVVKPALLCRAGVTTSLQTQPAFPKGARNAEAFTIFYKRQPALELEGCVKEGRAAGRASGAAKALGS